MTTNWIPLFVLAGATCSCLAPSLQTHATNNEDIPVEHLFSHDGCDAYRFVDGTTHWFVRCSGAPTERGAGAVSVTTLTRKSCGKSCVRDEAVPTFSVNP